MPAPPLTSPAMRLMERAALCRVALAERSGRSWRGRRRSGGRSDRRIRMCRSEQSPASFVGGADAASAIPQPERRLATDVALLRSVRPEMVSQAAALGMPQLTDQVSAKICRFSMSVSESHRCSSVYGLTKNWQRKAERGVEGGSLNGVGVECVAVSVADTGPCHAGNRAQGAPVLESSRRGDASLPLTPRGLHSAIVPLTRQ